ncbi:MAG: energy-coupling factor transporter ATPase [Lachnospiraceae bacterium]|nr:energy-coupling factor transporter ATPase [Lachnospiraceae bacterium]
MGIIEAKDLVYEYIRRDEEGNVESVNRAVDGLSLDINRGDFIAILGGNGSGKSTLAKHINAILYPTSGTIWVDGKDTADPQNLWDVRQNAGMIFQNPDNQIIGNVVEEDVGFGPENMGVPTKEIWERVEEALKAVGMYEYRKSSPNRLSGGQKQRVAIAGVVAMHPKCIIMDEPTAMLDPSGRREVIRVARALNQVEEVTIVLITHYMEEVIYADKVFVMDRGRIALSGTPREIFSNVEKMKELRLDVPQATLLSYGLKKRGLELPKGILSIDEIIPALCSLGKKYNVYLGKKQNSSQHEWKQRRSPTEKRQQDALIFDHVSHTYEAGLSHEVKALDDVSLAIYPGEFIGLIGHTGSGKSTLVQHMNGLLKASSGSIYYRGQDVYEKTYSLKKLRTSIGLVFQYPEHQLFEETVFKDVCFGARNKGLSAKEAELKAFEALRQVKLPEDLYYASPFELSGGQKRRVAIAGVLAMQPDILVLDEPTAGLDPRGRDEILSLVEELRTKNGISIVLVSHSMEDVANYVDRMWVMDKGKIILDGTPEEVFSRYVLLEEMGLRGPEVMYIMDGLEEKGFDVYPYITTLEEAEEQIASCFGLKGGA